MSDAEYLLEVLERAAEGLPTVARKFMFGCHALFADGKIFGLVWDGRIALKVPPEAGGEALARLDGAEPWSPNGKVTMRSWTLVPEGLHDDDDALRPWVERAHRAARAAAKAPPKKKPSSKKPSRKKAPPKKKRRATRARR